VDNITTSVLLKFIFFFFFTVYRVQKGWDSPQKSYVGCRDRAKQGKKDETKRGGGGGAQQQSCRPPTLPATRKSNQSSSKAKMSVIVLGGHCGSVFLKQGVVFPQDGPDKLARVLGGLRREKKIPDHGGETGGVLVVQMIKV